MSLTPNNDTFWHTMPLHYVPYLLHTGALVAQSQFAARRLPILPRPTAARRDRKLGLEKYVHFSFTPRTPLLADKQKKGYPHVLLEWNAQISELPGAAFSRYNAKKWTHRDDFTPLANPDEKAAFLQERTQTGKFPSAELLIPDAVPLAPLCVALHTENNEMAAWIGEIREAIRPALAPPVRISPAFFPGATVNFDWEPFRGYLQHCVSWGIVARALGENAPPFPVPPNLPFD